MTNPHTHILSVLTPSFTTLINTSSCPSQSLTETTQLDGFTRQNNTLNSINIALDQQVQLASFHLEGIALQWHRWMTKFREPLTWDEFTKDVQLRFGPIDYENPSEDLTRLKQTITVAAYQEAFENLSYRVDDLLEIFLIGCFIAGLRDDIRIDVQIKQPRTLADALGVASLIEEPNQLQKIPNQQLCPHTTFLTKKASPNPIVGVLGPPPT